jgi:GNAT superfamily N-acetyltransferase
MNPAQRPISIREITEDDADAAARLSGELGYPADPADVRQRIATIRAASASAVFVACASHHVIGWIDVSINRHLAIGAFAEIGGFVVSGEHRGRGIGRMLLDHAERWAAAQGVATMIVRSRTSRERAHRFYLREGYTILKTSAVFTKKLAE